MAVRILAVLFSSLLVCAAKQPAEDIILTSIIQGSMAAAALQRALFPAHLNATPDGPRRHPHTAPLLHALLDSVDAPTASEHWQGSRASLEALQELVRSGRVLLPWAPPGHHQSPHPHQQLRPPGASWSSWLEGAERVVAAVPEGPSYPQLRRAVVALLAEAWLAAGAAWSKADDEVAVRILLKLYALHAASSGRKSSLEYYHFSKAAGTSVCATSAAVGCTTFSVAEQYTCLVPEFGDGPRWINRKAHNARCRRALPGFSQCLTKLYTKLAKWGLRYSPRAAVVGCSERAAWLSDRGYNFYASEYTLRGRGGNVSQPPELCSNFLNLAVLRAPQARLLSHMRYIVRITYDWLGERTAQYMRNMSLQDWRRLAPAAFDNYYTRCLLGEEAFYARTGALNASHHLPAARAVLGAMDVLLLMEDSDPLLHLSHTWGLGWRETFMKAEGRSSSRVGSEVAQLADRVVPTGPAAEELAAANRLDEQLYEYAVLLSRLDSVVWAAAEAAGVVPPEATKFIIGKESAGRGGGGGGGSAERRPCGYVAAAWPRPSAPPPAPNNASSWSPLPPAPPPG